MIWIAIRAFGGRLFRWAGAALEWTVSDARHISIVGLAIVAAVMGWQLHTARATVTRLTAQVADEKAAHLVTLASLATMRRALDEKNAETDARGAAYRQSAVDARQAVAQADIAFRPAARAIRTVEAAIGQHGDGCTVPADVLGALP